VDAFRRFVVPGFQFGCPFCGAVSEVDASQAGQETVCPACENVLLVPVAEDAPAVGVEIVSVEELKRSLPLSKPKAAKTKLWQKAPNTSSDAGSTSVEADLPQPIAPKPKSDPLAAKPRAQTANEVVDISLAGDASATEMSFSERADRIVRDQRRQRREISNAVMLVGSIVILIGALAGLMWLSAR
jgi:hypothetical protein